VEEVSRSFHTTVVEALTATAVEIRRRTGLNRVALSGGCFQNRILLEGCLEELGGSGFEVFSHEQVPTNDGGVSLGQAVVAGARVKKGL